MKFEENRREFLISAVRYALLAALGLQAGRKIVQSVQSECRADLLCDRCEKLDQCEKPKALSNKKNSKMETFGRVR